MKQQDMIVVGLAGLALLLIIKATAKKTSTQKPSASAREPFRAKGDGSTGNWANDFGYAQDQQFLNLIGL